MKCLVRWDMGFLSCKDNGVEKSCALEESFADDSSAKLALFIKHGFII
jgi:hypothetical protein